MFVIVVAPVAEGAGQPNQFRVRSPSPRAASLEPHVFRY